MSGQILIAGIGNIFFGDDAFGVHVAQRLASVTLPRRVTAVDYGIRGMHLAYEMLDGDYDTTIMVDAFPRRGTPGTLYLIEADPAACDGTAVDAHGMTPQAVLSLLLQLGGVPGRVLVLGCEPQLVEEGIGLSEPVTAAVDEAVRQLVELVSPHGIELQRAVHAGEE